MKAKIINFEWITKGLIAETLESEVTLPKKNRLEYFQKIVGGYIDIVTYNGKDIVVNDEGILLQLPLNPWCIDKDIKLFGTIILCDGILD